MLDTQQFVRRRYRLAMKIPLLQRSLMRPKVDLGHPNGGWFEVTPTSYPCQASPGPADTSGARAVRTSQTAASSDGL